MSAKLIENGNLDIQVKVYDSGHPWLLVEPKKKGALPICFSGDPRISFELPVGTSIDEAIEIARTLEGLKVTLHVDVSEE